MEQVFFEKPDRHSTFLRFQDRAHTFDSISAEIELPKLSYLRVEFSRVMPGMSDFIIRVATPSYKSVKSNTVLSIRGNRQLTKYEKVRKLAEVICSNMHERGDQTHTWDVANHDHLADLLFGSLKYFAVNLNTDSMRLTTEALA